MSDELEDALAASLGRRHQRTIEKAQAIAALWKDLEVGLDAMCDAFEDLAEGNFGSAGWGLHRAELLPKDLYDASPVDGYRSLKKSVSKALNKAQDNEVRRGMQRSIDELEEALRAERATHAELKQLCRFEELDE